MRRPLYPSFLMEHINGKTHHEKTEGRKHLDLIDSREAKKASEYGREVNARPKPMKHKSQLSIFLSKRKKNKQEPVTQVMGII